MGAVLRQTKLMSPHLLLLLHPPSQWENLLLRFQERKCCRDCQSATIANRIVQEVFLDGPDIFSTLQAMYAALASAHRLHYASCSKATSAAVAA